MTAFDIQHASRWVDLQSFLGIAPQQFATSTGHKWLQQTKLLVKYLHHACLPGRPAVYVLSVLSNPVLVWKFDIQLRRSARPVMSLVRLSWTASRYTTPTAALLCAAPDAVPRCAAAAGQAHAPRRSARLHRLTGKACCPGASRTLLLAAGGLPSTALPHFIAIVMPVDTPSTGRPVHCGI